MDQHTLERATTRFYDLGVYPDWWKLPPQEPAAWSNIAAVIEARDPHCRGIVLLGLDAPVADLANGFQDAAREPWVKGFTVGRSLWSLASMGWLKGELTDDACIETIAGNYLRMIELWRSRSRIQTG